MKLAEVAELVNGFAFKSSHFTESEGTPLVRIRDIRKGKPGTRYNAPLDDPKMRSVTDGEIVIGMDGDFNSVIWKGGKALLNQRVCTLRADERFFSQKLLAYALPAYLSLINDHTSSITVKHLSSRTVQEIPLPLPPLNEQQRLVEKIETLFARLDKGDEAVRDVQKLLTRYRQSVLKSAVTGQLTVDWRAQRKDQLEQGDNLLARILETRRKNWDGRGKYKDPLEPEIGQFSDLPEGWTWASVDQVSSHFGNGLSKKPVLEENEFPILRISAARAMKVSVDDLRYYDPSEGENIDRFWVKTGDLLFTRYNGSARLVGVCGQMREEQSVLHPDKLIKARPIELPELSTDFLELAWNCGVTRQHIAKNIKTTAGQQGVAGSDIKTAPFPLPSGPEQIEIATRVWDVFDRTDAMANWCETELKRSASLRQSILKDAFAGKLVPQDPTDEPASALLARIAAEKPTAKKTRRKTTA